MKFKTSYSMVVEVRVVVTFGVEVVVGKGTIVLVTGVY